MSKEKLEALLNEAACIYDAPDMAQVAEHLIKNNVVVLQRDAAQEQIDELESVLYEANHKKSVLDYRWLATAAYNAGYRKQSENTIELPCKVGDTIFVIRNDTIKQETVRGIKIGNCGLLLQVSKGVDDFEYHYEIEIGNKLFFAKEDAEKALAKMKGGAE